MLLAVVWYGMISTYVVMCVFIDLLFVAYE